MARTFAVVLSTFAISWLMALQCGSAFGQGGGPGRNPLDPFPEDDLGLKSPPEFGPDFKPGPPGPSPTPGSLLNPPGPAQVWKCSHCGAVLGTGVEPKLDRCPKCGVELTSRFNYYVLGTIGGILAGGFLLFSVIRTLMRQGPR
jgi:hypothetical protein